MKILDHIAKRVQEMKDSDSREISTAIATMAAITEIPSTLRQQSARDGLKLVQHSTVMNLIDENAVSEDLKNYVELAVRAGLWGGGGGGSAEY